MSNKPNNTGQYTGWKRVLRIVASIFGLVLIVGASLIIIGLLGLGDPHLYVVYHVEKVTERDILMNTVRFNGQASPYKADSKLFKHSYFSSENQKKLKVGSFCYFYLTGSGPTIAAAVTSDSRQAEAYAKGFPGELASWDQFDFGIWVDDPIAFNKRYREPQF